MPVGYSQFCPVAMASEILCTRWTTLVIREMLCGSTRFNELRRGVPRMSPTLLSKRLGELEAAGIVTSGKDESGYPSYRLTRAGEDLRPLIIGIGTWGQRWVESDLSLDNLDPELLIWDMHRCMDVDPLPKRRVCLQFVFSDLPRAKQDYWLLVDPESGVEACYIDPGFDVDLFSESSLRVMTAIWMGMDSVSGAISRSQLQLTGDRDIATNMQAWLGLSPFSTEPRMVS